jgi:phosphatidylserine decarboxylase
MTFAREGWPFVLPFPLVAGLLLLLGYPRTALAVLIAGLLVLLFFRDPSRHYDGPAEMVLAPADGKVISVEEMEDPEIGPGRFLRIATFLSVFDVHVQKVPAAGEVLASTYTEGKKMAAFKSGIDRVNQRHLAVLKRPNGDLLGVRQIAGLFARRVVCYLKKGERVHRGQALGVIKFGSRVDLFVPATYTVHVKAGDRLKNGETPVAEPTPPRGGEHRGGS